MWVWDQLAAVFDYAQSHLAVTLVAVFVGTLALSFLHASLTPPPQPAVYKCAAAHADAPLTCSGFSMPSSCHRTAPPLWTGRVAPVFTLLVGLLRVQ